MTGILDSLATRVLGNPTEAANTMLKRFLVAAVRRILTPGEKVDTILVLYEPDGGHFKSTFAEMLFGAEWFKDQMPSLEGRDASHALEGAWGVELPELDALRKTETLAQKAFLSRRTDKYRAFGTGGKVEFPRQCVFMGTTNDAEFLTVNDRRFLPVEVFGKIVLAFVRQHRDAIWAEAVTLALMPKPEAGEEEAPGVTYQHWLTDAEEEVVREVRTVHTEVDAWADAVKEYCQGRDEASTTAIYLEKIAVGEDGALSKAPQGHKKRIGVILKTLDCKSVVRKIDGKYVRVWRMSEALRNARPSKEKGRLFS